MTLFLAALLNPFCHRHNERRTPMNMKEIAEAKKAMEEDIFKVVNNFELKSDCIVEGIALKHRRIEAGIGSRDVLDKVKTRVVLPDFSSGEEVD